MTRIRQLVTEDDSLGFYPKFETVYYYLIVVSILSFK